MFGNGLTNINFMSKYFDDPNFFGGAYCFWSVRCSAFITLFSLPKQHSGRAIVLLLALALASSSAKSYIKVFRISLFPNPMMDLVHVWYDDRYWSKILRGSIPSPVHEIKVKVTHLEFLFMLIVFSVSFCKAFDGFDSCLA